MNARDRIVPPYLQICRDAAANPNIFRIFKRHPHYNAVLEHLSDKLGQAHWAAIKDCYFSGRDIEAFLQNDRYGDPIRYQYGMFRASPTTIQYISVLFNLMELFGSLKGFSICEIGGGYGGQAKIVKDKFQVYYDIIDLKEATMLQKTYLGKLSRLEDVQFFTNEDYQAQSYSLVISNYALSEIPREEQLRYVEKICMNSQRGYLTCNQPLNGLDLLKNKFSDLEIKPDIEGERKENFVVVWGHR